MTVTGTVDTVNGTFCQAEADLIPIRQHRSDFLKCNVVGHPLLEACRDAEGDHGATFFSYLAARTAFQWSINIMFGVMDGTTLTMAKQHKSDYSRVAVFTQLATTFGMLVPGFILDDGTGGESTDYTILFYIQDICLAISIVFVLTLDVRMERSGQKTLEALKNIWSRPAMILFTMLTLVGAMWGIQDTYAIAYLSDEQGASSQLISTEVLSL